MTYEERLEMYLLIPKTFVTVCLGVFLGIQTLDDMRFCVPIFFLVGVLIAIFICALHYFHKKGVTSKEITIIFFATILFPIWVIGLAAWNVLQSFFSKKQINESEDK